MNYTIDPTNYGKPTPPWVKWVADILLFLSAAVVLLPDFPQKEWVIAGGAIAKLLSNFITAHATPEFRPKKTKKNES